MAIILMLAHASFVAFECHVGLGCHFLSKFNPCIIAGLKYLVVAGVIHVFMHHMYINIMAIFSCQSRILVKYQVLKLKHIADGLL